MQKMSGVTKPLGLELKPPDKGEQPIDLAPRAAHSIKSSLPQVITTSHSLRPHLDRSAFTAVSLRVPAGPRAALQTPITVAPGSAQPFPLKSATGTAGAGSASQISALRHVVSSTTTSAHSAMSLSSSVVPSMASIIRGGSTHTMTATQVTHQTSHQYSSHVPRGPAAVANISTAPKSALATPMLRSSVNSASTTSHIHVGARASALVPTRPSFTPLSRSVPSVMQVMDLQNRSGAHGTAPVQLGLSSSRPQDSATRTTLGHPSVAGSKPLHMTQPIVHSLHQVSEKPFKCVTTSPSVNYAAVHGIPSCVAGQPAVATTLVPSAVPATATVAPPRAQLVSHPGPTRTSLTTMSLVTLAPAMPDQVSPQVAQVSQPLPLHGPTSSPLAGTVGTSAIPSLFTVVSSKASSTAVTTSPHGAALTTALVVGQSRIGTPSATAPGATTPVTSTSSPVVPGGATVVSRPITTTVSIHPPPVSVTTNKLFGQTLSVPGPHGTHLEPTAETSVPGSLYVTQPARNLTATVSPTGAVSTTSALPAAVVLSDGRSDRGSSQLPGAASYAVPTAYLYESYPIQGAITMHPYAPAATVTGTAGMTPVFPTTTVRPARPHGAQCPSSAMVHPTSQPGAAAGTAVRPVVVAVDAGLRPHVTLHTSFAPTVPQPHGHISTSGESGTSTSATAVLSATPPYGCTTPSNLLSPTHSATPPNYNTSPRPSILRKRTFEGVSVGVKKNLLASMPGSEPASPRPEAAAPSAVSPKPASDFQQESSNSSSSQSSSNTPENSRQPTPAVAVKQEPPDACETPGLALNGSSASLPTLAASVEASPRKKPRKQLLSANELLDTHSTDGEDDLERDSRDGVHREVAKDDNARCITFCKRPAMSLLTTYSHSWKSRHNHFARHSDVKPKDDKKLTVNDLANQKGVLQKANGWKVFHLTSQMEEVFFLEDAVYSKLSQLLDFIENKPPAIQNKPLNPDEERILNKISDLVKGNLQRSKIVQDQVTEAKQQMHKVLEHKQRIVEIIGKYVSKRPLKKREKM